MCDVAGKGKTRLRQEKPTQNLSLDLSKKRFNKELILEQEAKLLKQVTPSKTGNPN